MAKRTSRSAALRALESAPEALRRQLQARGRKGSVKKRNPGPRLNGLFLLGALVLNYPLLSLFSHQNLVFGVPVFYLYIFVSWALLIAFLALVADFFA